MSTSLNLFHSFSIYSVFFLLAWFFIFIYFFVFLGISAICRGCRGIFPEMDSQEETVSIQRFEIGIHKDLTIKETIFILLFFLGGGSSEVLLNRFFFSSFFS